MSSQKKNMQYVRLGNSGLKVSRVILGTMSYGSPEWQKWVLDEEEGIKHIKLAYEMGIQTFDTANAYSNGLSEVVLGKAIKQLNLPRDEIVVMTKVYFQVGHRINEFTMGGGGPPNEHGLSRKHIFDSIKRSLERLQLDYVDVLQCHRFDYNTPIAETMQALHDGGGTGDDAHIENVRSWIDPLVSPSQRILDSLIGRYGKAHEGNSEIVRRVESLAKKKNLTMAQVALAWVMSKDQVSAPIVGTTNIKNLEELIAAVSVKLDDEEIKHLEEPYAPQAIFGHS
ncbi:Aldo/kereductase family [Rhizoctonia solani]|uniref:Aldo/kereductase family n=1 Tax=Rhizoctonia solani TaxID=456999 RepID=A0A8H7LPN0_9AGAM|nr:Aldo/kereductase family [Rhizoctonia solani]